MKPKWRPSQLQRYCNLIKNVKNWTDYLSLKLNIVRRDNTVFSTPSNVQIEVPTDMLHTFKEVFMDDTYFRGFNDLRLDEPIIFDVGANVGYFSLFAASKFPHARIFAFEPMPNNFRLLFSHCERNSHVSITPFQKAVSDRNDSVTMSYNSADDFSTVASIFSDNHPNCNDRIDVDCINLETACKTQGIDKIDFLKMDCEGAEHNILRNCPEDLLKSIEYIAMEVHPSHGPEADQDSLCNFLRANGYKVVIATNARGEHPLVWAHRK